MGNLKGLLFGSLALLSASSGCAGGGVWLRPDGSPGPQECSEEAQKAVRALNLQVGDGARIHVDVNQAGSESVILHDGPIVSVLLQDFGPFPKTSRLYGRAWTSGPQVVVRYYEAQPPNGKKVPICAVARLADDEMWRSPEFQPGTAILDAPYEWVIAVNAFR